MITRYRITGVVIGVLVGWFASTRPLHAQEVALSATTDSTSYHIGQWIQLTVEADASPQVVSIAPVVPDTLGPFEILSLTTGEPQIDPQKRVQSWSFRLITFEPGDIYIPPIEFEYRLSGVAESRTASTRALPLRIVTVAVDTAGDIKDIKPPLEVAWAFEDYLPYIIAVLLLALLGAGFWYYQKRKQRAVPEPVVTAPRIIPPHERALAALRALEDRKLWQNGKVKEYYSEVTEIVRKFLGERFNILAIEVTSDELMHQMKRIPQAQASTPDLGRFLTTADLVKFAKYIPAPDENAEELALAYGIVRSMIPTRPAPQMQSEEKIVHAG